MKTAVKSPDTARFRRPVEHSSFQRFSFQHFSISALPKFPFSPATPISPPSGPTQWLFQGPPAESNLLAANFYHHQGRTLKHILVSVWHASYTYGSRFFQVFINCYTGKTAGEHSLSWVKITLAVLAVLIVILIVLGLRNS